MKNYTTIKRLQEDLNKAINEKGLKIRKTDVKKINKSNLQDGYNLNVDYQRQELNLALLDLLGRIYEEDGNIENLFDSILYVTFGANDDKEAEILKAEQQLLKAEIELQKLEAKNTTGNRKLIAKAINQELNEKLEIVENGKKSNDYKEKKKKEYKEEYEAYLDDQKSYVKKLKDRLKNLKTKQSKATDDEKINELNIEIDNLKSKIEKFENILNNSGLELQITKAKQEVSRRRKEVEIKQNLEKSAFEKKTSKENRINAHKNGLSFKKTYIRNGEEYEVVEHFEYYMRSSSQARKGTEQYFRTSMVITNKSTGEVVEKIDNSKVFEEHKKWLNLGMDLSEQDPVSLGAYNSLVSSKLETTITLDAKKHILIIPDLQKNITEKGYVNYYKEDIIKDKDGHEIARKGYIETELKDNVTFTNSLFDGQAIGSKEFFEDELKDRSGSSQLFRQRFTKFNCVSVDFQNEWRRQFEEDKKNGKYPKDMKYEDLEVTNIDGRKVKAVDVKVITTPSAIKLNKMCMKDSHGKRMTTIEKLSHWFDLVEQDGNLFGIVKEEHSAKTEDLLSDESANLTGEIQNSSYQHISSLQYEKGLGEKIFGEYDKQIIEEMKNNPSYFANYLEKNKNDMNDYEHHLQLMKLNADYCKTEEYQAYVKNVLDQYVKKVKHGGVKVAGAYHTILMNPELMVDFAYAGLDGFKEMLKESEEGKTTYVLKDDVTSKDYGKYTKKNENGEIEVIDGVKFYSKSFAYGEECALLRNPHATASNIGHGVNCCNPNSENRLNRLLNGISSNVIVIDGTVCPIQDILQGSDYL